MIPLQLIGSLIAVLTPLLVVLILNREAFGAVGSLPRTLIATTVIAAILVTVLSFAEVAPGTSVSLMSLGLFVLLSVIGWPSMKNTESAALEALTPDRPPVRRASLVRRGSEDVLPRISRMAAPILALGGTVLVVLRTFVPTDGERRIVIPLLFGLVAVVFYVLYEIWIRREAESVLYLDAGEGDERWLIDRRQRVRRLSRIQVALVAIFVTTSLLLISIDWASPAGNVAVVVAIALGGVAGVVGCAIAISSGMTPAEVRRSRTAESALNR